MYTVSFKTNCLKTDSIFFLTIFARASLVQISRVGFRVLSLFRSVLSSFVGRSSSLHFTLIPTYLQLSVVLRWMPKLCKCRSSSCPSSWNASANYLTRWNRLVVLNFRYSRFFLGLHGTFHSKATNNIGFCST